MNRGRQAPLLARWILARLLRGERRDALIGDLAEEYQHGRTRAWYWRQTLYAVALGLREHPPRRLGLGVLRVLMIACLLVGASLDWKWPLFIFALDPTIWDLLHRRKRRSNRDTARGQMR